MKRPSIAERHRFVRQHRAAWAVAAAAAAWLGSAERASAYSDPERFQLESAGGGGGGRFFTGSPVDGYNCAVCHDGDLEGPAVTIRGLPVATGYVPGQTYDVEISWGATPRAVGIQLELVGRDGHMAGTVSLPDEATLPASGHCGGLMTEAAAAYLTDVPDEGRTIVGLRSCDAKSLRFSFVAPNSADLAFSGGLISSDDSATATGDAFVSLNRVLYRAGESKPATSSSCALVPGAALGGADAAALMGVASVLAALVRRRRARR